MTWHAYEDGTTIGTKGSEEGIILRDEEHPGGSRIALEQDARNAPFAITCGIYCSLLHTTFAGTETEAVAKYENMKGWLTRLLAPNLPDDEYRTQLQQFVDAFR